MLYPRSVAEIPGPMRIVFDLQQIEPDFKRRTAWMKDYTADLTELMELLPCYINEIACAQDGLNALLERIIEDHNIGDAPGDGQICARAAEMVGKYMIEQYTYQGLYEHNGICHYVFEGWLDAQSPVFVKTAFEELYEI